MGSEEKFLALNDEFVLSKIVVIRQHKAMLRALSATLLDKDLALLYQVETKYLNYRVNVNLERPPPSCANTCY